MTTIVLLIESMACFVRIFTYWSAYAFAAFCAIAGLELSVVIWISVVVPISVMLKPEIFPASVPSSLLTAAWMGPDPMSWISVGMSIAFDDEPSAFTVWGSDTSTVA